MPQPFRKKSYDLHHNLSHPRSKTLVVDCFLWKGLRVDIRNWWSKTTCCRFWLSWHQLQPYLPQFCGPLAPSHGSRSPITFFNDFTRCCTAIPHPNSVAETVVRAYFAALGVLHWLLWGEIGIPSIRVYWGALTCVQQYTKLCFAHLDWMLMEEGLAFCSLELRLSEDTVSQNNSNIWQ